MPTPHLTTRRARPQLAAGTPGPGWRGLQAWRAAFVGFGVTGTMAGLALGLAAAVDIRAWVLFLAWVGHGLLSANGKGGARLLLGFVIGAVAGMTTASLGSAWEPWLGEAAMPMALGLSCGLLAILERRPPLDLVPAYFLGMISFFATGEQPAAPLLMELSTAAALGVAWGWSSTWAQTALLGRLKGS